MVVPDATPLDNITARHERPPETWRRAFPSPSEQLSATRAAEVTYRFGPDPAFDSQFYAPLLGTGVLLTGSTSRDYDGWCRAVAGLAETGITGAGPLVDANYGGFTRQALILWRGDTGGNGTLDIANMTVRTGMNSSAGTLVDVPTSFVPFVVDGKANPDFAYTGEWTVSPTLPDGTPYATLMSGPANASTTPSLKVTVPKGTAFLIVNGTARSDVGALGVTWSPIPEYVLEANPRGGRGNGTYYPPSNAGNAFVAPGEVVYYAALNPTETYTLELGPYGQSDTKIDLFSITFYASA
jgi:hypothetical protein